MKFEHVHGIFSVAAQRHDDDGLLQYARLPAVQLASPAQLQQLLLLGLEMFEAALVNDNGRVSANSIIVCRVLLERKCAQQLDSSMILSLLEASFSSAQSAPKAATVSNVASVWMMLCELPQAVHVDHISIISLLETYVSSRAAKCGHDGTAALCGLLEQKTAQAGWGGLTCQQAEQLLARALPIRNGGSLSGLRSVLELECVQQAIDSSAAMRLLGRALVFRGLKKCKEPAAAVEQLLQLPAAAAAAIPATDLVQLTACVLQHCSTEELKQQLLQVLLSRGSLPGPDELASLITMCLQDNADECAAACIRLLCDDPAAQQISSSTLLLLLLDAVEAQQPQAMLVLTQWLSAAFGQLSSNQVEQLLLAAGNAALDSAETEEERWLEAVCAVIRVPAVHAVDAGVVAQLLTKAASQGAAECMEHFLRISSVQQLEKARVGSLLQLAASSAAADA
jgi:hypothetical protein